MLAYLRRIRVLTCSLLLVFLLRTTRGENCRINPECSCTKSEGTYVSCTQRYGPYFPKFAASSSQLGRITVDGSREIREIRTGSFLGVSATSLTIFNTGITDIRCHKWLGLSELTELDLNDNELTSIPRCSLKMLRTLRLGENNLTAIEPGAFRNFSKLESLDLKQNHIAVISSGAFDGLSLLSTLYIGWNNLTIIGSNTFIELTSLKRLDLQNNRITTVHAKAFDGLLNLETLYIRNNHFSEMDSATFFELKQLTTLYIENNKILEISEDLLKSIKKLKDFRVGNNSLSALSSRVFKENREMEYLDLSNNRLASLHPGTFSTTAKLKQLLLSNNSLTHIQPAVFWQLPNLTRLDLSSNKLTELENGLFSNCKNLGTIDLRGNKIDHLHADPFENATSLHTLDLSDNRLENLLDERLLVSAKLSILRLSANKIAFLSNTTILRHRNRMYYLDLSDNGLTSESWPWLEEIIRGLSTYARVNLAHNNFTHVAPDIAARAGGEYEGVNFSDNRLQKIEISLFDLHLTDWVFYHNNITSVVIIDNSKNHDPQRVYISKIYVVHNKLSDPILLKTRRPVRRIYRVDLSYNIITKMEKFPVQTVPPKTLLGCPTFNVTYLNLSHNAINVVPAEACLGIVEVLDLRDNIIEVLGPLVPEYSSSRYRLREIYLSGNRIHRISSDVFTLYAGYLKQLDLSYNNITNVDSLRALRIGGIIHRYSRLRLFGNPIHCDCDTDWLRNGTSAPRVDSVRCYTPTIANGFLVNCFDPPGCGHHYEQTDYILDVCEKDTYVSISNLTTRTLNSAGWPRINVTWSRTGPGVVTAFRITTYSNSEQTDTLPPGLVGPEVRNAVILYSDEGHDFRICISALMDTGDVTEEVCESANQDFTNRGSTRGQQQSEGFCMSKGLFVGLITCLAVIVLILSGGITIYLIRRRRSRTKGETVDAPPSTKENVNMYSNPTDYENADNEKGQYETMS